MYCPFNYKLVAHSDGETRETVADIPETFNYLPVLRLRRVYGDGGHRYSVYRGKNHEESAVKVVWRETEEWEKKDYTHDLNFIGKLKLAAGADEVFVNRDSLIPDAQTSEPLFKFRMFAGVGV